jgi:hypothetical protein
MDSPRHPAHLGTIPHISSTVLTRRTAHCEHLKDIPVAAETIFRANGTNTSNSVIGGSKVLAHRATTGFSGLIVVAAILLVAQLLSGVAAFPL